MSGDDRHILTILAQHASSWQKQLRFDPFIAYIHLWRTLKFMAEGKNHWNHKITANRNPTWRTRMIEGKQRYAEHPSKLRLVRIVAGKSQDDIAKAAGLSLTTYGDIERGKRSVRKETGELIAEIMGKSRESLFVRKKGSRYLALKQGN